MCMDNSQCDEDLICTQENVTKPTALNRNSNNNFPQPQFKLCLCDEASGFVEDPKYPQCNGKLKKNKY